MESILGLVSIIIPTYNRRVDLDKCLETVFCQMYPLKEVIVVDDGSKDDTVDYVRLKYPLVRLIVNARNRGPNYCRNLGVIHSEGEFVLFLDSDVELTNKEQTGNMVKIARKTPNLGALGAYYYDEKDYKAQACVILGEIIFCLKDNEALQECDFISSCNMFMRKNLVYENKGFDEFIRGDGTEMEMGLNLKSKGYANLFGPSVAARHNFSPIERNNLLGGSMIGSVRMEERLIYRRKNRFRYFIKNHSVGKGFSIFISFLIKEDIIAILAFIKQQFLGFRVRDSVYFTSFREKIYHLYFLARMIYEPMAWNLIHLKETIKCRDINFLDGKIDG